MQFGSSMNQAQSKPAPKEPSFINIVRDWTKDECLATIMLESVMFRHRYMIPATAKSFAGRLDYVNVDTNLGWINEEECSVELITGIIRGADPEFFDKLRYALNKAAQWCCAMHEERRLTMDPLFDRGIPANYFISAKDVIDRLGEPKLL